jgi:Flp pilus assembly protein TadB
MKMSAKIATGASYGAGTVTLLIGGLSLSDWAAVAGIFSLVATFILAWYFKRREYKRKQAFLDEENRRAEEKRAEEHKLALLDAQLREMEIAGMQRRKHVRGDENG